MWIYIYMYPHPQELVLFQEPNNLPGFLLVSWQIQECLRRQKEEVGKIIRVNKLFFLLLNLP